MINLLPNLAFIIIIVDNFPIYWSIGWKDMCIRTGTEYRLSVGEPCKSLDQSVHESPYWV